MEKNDFVGWQFKDVLDRLLDIVISPIKFSITELLKQAQDKFNAVGDYQNIGGAKPMRHNISNYTENIGMIF